jgi:hypothetical protein
VPAAGQVRPALQSLLARARTADALVVHIQNDGPQGSPDEPDTEGWELVFPPVPGELAIRKAEPDVFIADACLATTLTARHRRHLPPLQATTTITPLAWPDQHRTPSATPPIAARPPDRRQMSASPRVASAG